MQNKSKISHIEKIVKLMDSQYKIGGLKFGLDPILNFIPFLGDGITALISGLLVFTMYKHGASGKVVVKMCLNVLIDAIIGAIPLLGWVFDFYFKANEKNLKLLKEHYEDGKHQGSGRNIILLIIGSLILTLIIVLYFAWIVTAWLWNLLF